MAFVLVCIAWAFFRADSVGTALDLLSRIVNGWTTPSTLVTPTVLLWTGIGLATQFAPRRPAVLIQARLARLEPWALGLIGAVMLFTITTLGPRGVAPFIYFQF
jgi:hypothetical protein